MKRSNLIDSMRGLLILFVVIAHFQRDTIHDVIFLFHMPLFFVISGYLLKREKLADRAYLITKIKSLFVPYFTYLMIDFLLINRTYSVNGIIRMIYGGRAISGVYWYITCYILTFMILAFLLNHFSDNAVKALIFAGGAIAIVESHLIEKIHFLEYPGLPWNIDASLLALIYLSIGFFYKERIAVLLESDNRKIDLTAGVTSLVLIGFCVANYRGAPFYYFDMKPIYYKELISAIIIPCAFGFIIVRLIHWMEKGALLKSLNKVLAVFGRMTIPIMFMHVPLNTWKDAIGYNRGVYIFIGVGIPVVFTYLFGRFKVMRKIFGIPSVWK